MNTIQIQLNERKLADLTELLDEGLDAVSYKLRKEEADHYTQEDRDEITRLCGEGVSEIRQAIKNRDYLWTSSLGDIHLNIPLQAVEDIARPGQNLPAVQKWLSEPNYLKAQIDRWEWDDLQAARGCLKDAGFDGVEDMDDETVARHVLWIACHDVNEERHHA